MNVVDPLLQSTPCNMNEPGQETLDRERTAVNQKIKPRAHSALSYKWQIVKLFETSRLKTFFNLKKVPQYAKF